MAPFGSLGSFPAAIRRLIPVPSNGSMSSATDSTRTSRIADIWRSAENDDVGAITAYYDAGGQVDRRHHETHWTALAIAARRGHLASVKELISMNASLDKEMEYQYTALLLAANCGSDRIPCPHAGEVDGVCPHILIAEALLDAGAAIDLQTDQKFTVLGMASLYGHLRLVKKLLTLGADIEHRNCQNFTSLALAAQGGHLEIARLLLDAGAPLEPRTDIGLTPLGVAAQEGHEKVVKEFLSRGAEVEVRDKEGNTPLMLAADYGQPLVVELLLHHDAILEVSDSQGRTALYLAASAGHASVVEQLIASGSDVCRRDRTQRSALMAAAQNAHHSVCKLLLEAGAPVEDASDGGLTALIWAARGEDRQASGGGGGGGGGGVGLNGKPPSQGGGGGGGKQDSVDLQHQQQQQIKQIKHHASAASGTASTDEEFGGGGGGGGSGSGHGVGSASGHGRGGGGKKESKGSTSSSTLSSDLQDAQEVLREEARRKELEEQRTRRVLTVKCLLAAGANVFARTVRGNTALMTACISGNAEVIPPLLEAGVTAARVNAGLLADDTCEAANETTATTSVLSTTNSQGFTALLLACQGGHGELACDLLKRGASIDCCTMEGYTPLLLSAEKGLVQAVQTLLDKGADLNVRQNTGDNALQLAAYFGHPEVVELLLKKGADKNVVDEDGSKPGDEFEDNVGLTARVKVTTLLKGEAAAKMLQASWELAQGSAISTFLGDDDKELSANEARGARRTTSNSYNRTSGETTMSATSGEASTLRKPAANPGGLTDARYRRSSTPNVILSDHNAQRKWTRLHIAAYNGDVAEVGKLLKLGASCESKIEHNFTVLMVACQANKPDIVKMLMEHGAKLEAVSDRGFTPLLVAAKNGHVEVAKMLLAGGATYGAQNERGFTALLLASQNGDVGLVQLLMDCPSFNAKILEAATDQGFTPLLAACRNGHDEVVTLLLAKGADALAVNKAKCNALHLACERGSVKVMKLLLDHANKASTKLDLEARTATQDTALSIAAYFGNAPACRLLLSQGANPDTKDEEGYKPGECFDEDLSEGAIKDVTLALKEVTDGMKPESQQSASQ